MTALRLHKSTRRLISRSWPYITACTAWHTHRNSDKTNRRIRIFNHRRRPPPPEPNEKTLTFPNSTDTEQKFTWPNTFLLQRCATRRPHCYFFTTPNKSQEERKKHMEEEEEEEEQEAGVVVAVPVGIIVGTTTVVRLGGTCTGQPQGDLSPDTCRLE